MHEITQKAINAIGNREQTDWQLNPKKHAQDLNPEAGALKRILEKEELKEVIDEYEKENNSANKLRDTYKRVSWIAAGASFIAVIIASIILLGETSRFLEWFEGLENALLWGVGAQFVFLVISFGCSILIGSLRTFEKWMRARAKAENSRILLFNRVLGASEGERENELPLNPMKLEYFRRYQLDVQMKYYSERGDEHKKAADRISFIRIIAAGFVLLGAFPVAAQFLTVNGGVSELQELGSDFYQRLSLFFGLIGAAIQGLLATLSLISQHERNAAKYHDTGENLTKLRGELLDTVRDKVATGQLEDMRTFISSVQEQISSEHREWILLGDADGRITMQMLREMTLPKLP